LLSHDFCLFNRYVVKVLTYEVGILADVPNNETTNGTAEDPEVHQKVDLSFYDTDSNGTFLNFGDIPLPVQTNVSGQIITGIAPVHIGAVQNINEALEALPFSGTIVNITHSDTSYLTVDRENVTDQEQQTILKDDADLAKLPILNNVLLPDSFDKAEEQIEKIEHQKKS
jgi:hypothetical protein